LVAAVRVASAIPKHMVAVARPISGKAPPQLASSFVLERRRGRSDGAPLRPQNAV
jgi:hypothetical protein